MDAEAVSMWLPVWMETRPFPALWIWFPLTIFDLKALQKDGTLRWGSDLSKVYGDSGNVLATWDQNSSWAVGDIILVGNEQLTIAGLLKYDPFSGDGLTGGKITLITSGETFTRLTGITDYSLIMIQTTSGRDG